MLTFPGSLLNIDTIFVTVDVLFLTRCGKYLMKINNKGYYHDNVYSRKKVGIISLKSVLEK